MASSTAVAYLVEASEALIRERLAKWQEAVPGSGVVALIPEGESETLVPRVQEACRAEGVPLVGAVFPALIAEAALRRSGLLLIHLPRMPSYLLVEGLDVTGRELKQRVEALAGELVGRLKPEEEYTLFLVFDALVPKIATVLKALYVELSDRVRYFGVNAGSETFNPTPCLFDSERVVQGGVLALLLEGKREIALEHGYSAPAKIVAATSTEGNRIASIDWRPAFEVYRERVADQYDVEITKENFYHYAVHFPVGIIRANGEVLVRIPVALEDDGAIFCVGEVPENSILTLLESPKAGEEHTVRQLAQGLSPDGEIVTFYCAGRTRHLGAAAAEELEKLAHYTKASLFGALSLGEIGSSDLGGYPLFHNAAVVGIRL